MSQQDQEQQSEEPTWLDRTYVLEILDHITQLDLEELKDFSKSPATSKGENYGSALHLLHVRYTVKKQPSEIQELSLIVKSRLDNEFMSQLDDDFNVFLREAQFYKIIMGKTEKILADIGEEIKFGPR